MPVLHRDKLDKLRTEFNNRYGRLYDLIIPRCLEDKFDGAGKGYWRDWEHLRKTEGTKLEIDMAIADFETILKELKKLK
jgi:hypothetical protein